jgi:hypothetical protein
MLRQDGSGERGDEVQKTQLDTTQLGTTGLEITRVGFGAWALGGAGYDWGWEAQDDDDSVAGEDDVAAIEGRA